MIDEEIDALAKTLYGEARGLKSKMEQAAVIWCILNRVDSEDSYYPDTIIEVITQKHQFTGYNSKYPVLEEFRELATDVLGRWYREKSGEENVGRVLPSNYLWFHGNGKSNIFRDNFSRKNCNYWDWRLENPYDDNR